MTPQRGGDCNPSPTAPATSPRRAAFLDRDGTIIEDRHYISDPAAVALIPGSATALHRLRELGLALVVVTNQSGIGRGLYTVADYRRVAAETERRLRARGIAVDATRFCTDAPGGDPRVTCRKPSPKMYLDAARELNLAPGGSYFVGDKRSDLLPARTLGGEGILVRTGHGRAHEPRLEDDFHVVDDLAAAAGLIARLESRRDQEPIEPHA